MSKKTDKEKIEIKSKKKKAEEIELEKNYKKQAKKQAKEEKRTKRKKGFIKILLFIIIILIIFLAIKTGISINNWKNIVQDMKNNTASKVIDTEGNIIAELGSEKKREKITSEKIPDNLKNAYVAIEDERFYNHHGVDIKRTSAAIANYIIHFGKSSFGGSTITQQTVKNLTGDEDASISRKLEEWIKAFEMELFLSKDEILETYLNVIYTGPSIYGVETAAQYYFSKSASELNLAECAFLAGINNAPNTYNPFGEKDNSEKIKKRTTTVLYKMLELNYINQAQYDEAKEQVEKGLQFKQKEIKVNNDGVYSYHTDALISQVVSDISKQKNISKTFATNYLNMAGLNIYSTQNSKIQKQIEDEFEKSKYILKSNNNKEETSQAAMVIINHTNGNVVRMCRRTWRKRYCKRVKQSNTKYKTNWFSRKAYFCTCTCFARKNYNTSIYI